MVSSSFLPRYWGGPNALPQARQRIVFLTLMKPLGVSRFGKKAPSKTLQRSLSPWGPLGGAMSKPDVSVRWFCQAQMSASRWGPWGRGPAYASCNAAHRGTRARSLRRKKGSERPRSPSALPTHDAPDRGFHNWHSSSYRESRRVFVRFFELQPKSEFPVFCRKLSTFRQLPEGSALSS